MTFQKTNNMNVSDCYIIRYNDGADLYRIKSIDSDGYYHSEVVEFSSHAIDYLEDDTTFDDFMCADATRISNEVFENVLMRVKSSVEFVKSKMKEYSTAINLSTIEKGMCLLSEKRVVRLGYKDQNNGKWLCEAIQMSSNSVLHSGAHAPMRISEEDLSSMELLSSEQFDKLEQLINLSVKECSMLVA